MVSSWATMNSSPSFYGLGGFDGSFEIAILPLPLTKDWDYPEAITNLPRAKDRGAQISKGIKSQSLSQSFFGRQVETHSPAS